MIDARLAPFSILFLYSIGVVVAGVGTGIPFVLLVVLLLLLPLVVLLQREHLAVQPLALMVLFGTTLLLVIETFATSTGSWYSVSSSSWQAWGGVTFEGILFGLLATLYLVVVYEYFFDDRASSGIRYHHGVLRSTILFLLLLAAAYVFLFAVLIVTYAFAWILGILLGAVCLMMLLASPKNPQRLLQKVFWYTVLIAPFILLLELVAAVYGIRVYAFTSEYIAVLPWYNATVPLEELLLALVVPGILILWYELFIDDAR